MGIISFPNIPQSYSNQVVSATQLMAYKKALSYLLGESHAIAQMAIRQVAMEGTDSDSGWQTRGERWLYHRVGTAIRLYATFTGNYGGPCYARLVYWDNSDVLQEVKQWTNPGTVNEDITPPAGMTAGKMYHWAIQLRCSNDDWWIEGTLIELSERGVVSDLWQSMPSFTPATSDPAQVEALRVNLNALYSRLVSPVLPLQQSADNTIEGHDDHDWHTYKTEVYQYRRRNLNVGFCCIRYSGYAARTSQWRVRFENMAGAGADIYTSPVYAGIGEETWYWISLDLGVDPVAAALVAAGITLTHGSYYKVIVRFCKPDGGEAMRARWGVVGHFLHPSLPPASGWQTLRDWQHGDTVVSPANMNALVSDINMLYSGGEALWGKCHSLRYSNDAGRFAGWHRKRWLCYRCVSGKTPEVRYGINFGQAINMPTGSGWVCYDTMEGKIPWGGAILVKDTSVAVESDVAVVQ